jgi:RNA polymerase sigma-70 factor (ECF subfamily)
MTFPIAILAIENDDDREYMEKLYIDHRQIMYKKAYFMLCNQQDAEDVINTACVALINNLSRLRDFDSCTLRAYIVSTIRNTAINCINKRNRISAHSVPDADAAFERVAPENQAPDSRIIQQAELEALKQALKTLPEKEMTLLQMKYVTEAPDEQIAKELGIRRASIRSYLTNARRHARAILKENAP